MLYDGFISYSHAREAAVARAIQSGLHRFARPWYRLRALRVFRDVTHLSANPGLWSSIETALGQTRFLLLLASPHSAASPWVQREIEWWLRHRQPHHLLLVVVDGALHWNNAHQDFDWEKTTVLPAGLTGAFREEPLYIDFRDFTSSEDLSLKNPAFSERIASLAATLHGRPKDEMIGEDVRQHRRAIRLAWSAAMTLAGFAVVATIAAFVAVHQRNIADERRQLAAARELVARGELLRGDRPDRLPAALLLGAEGLSRLTQLGAPTWEADQALRRALALSPEPLALIEHDEATLSFALSPDGTHLAVGANNGAVRVWALGAKPSSFDLAHGGKVWHTVFSPDSSLLVTSSWDGSVLITDVRSRSAPRPLLARHPVWAAAFSPDGRVLVTAGRHRSAMIWEPQSGRPLGVLPHESPVVGGIQFSADGRFILLQGLDGTAYLFDARSMKLIGRAAHPNHQLDAAVFSPDRHRLATRSSGTVFLHDVAAGKQLARLSERSIAAGTIVEDLPWFSDAIAFSPNSRWLYSAQRDRTLRIIDATTGNEARSIPHDQPVGGVVASPDGKLVATRSGPVVRLWDEASGVELARLTHDERVRHMTFDASGSIIATAAGKQIRVWRPASANPVARLPHERGVWRRLFSPDGRWLITQAPEKTIALWELPTMRRAAALPHPDLIRDVTFSPDSQRLATASNDRKIRVWETRSGRLVAEWETPLTPDRIRFSPGGHLLSVVANDFTTKRGLVAIYDARTDRVVFRQEIPHPCHHSAFTPDERWILVSDEQPSLHLISLSGESSRRLDGFVAGAEPFAPDGKALIVWREHTLAQIDVATMQSRASIQIPQKIKSTERSPDGRTVAVIADNTSDVYVWSPEDRTPLASLAHTLPVNAVRFSARGSFLVTGSGHPITGRGEARVWELPTGTLRVVQPHDRGVWSIDLSPDERVLVTLARDLPVQLWLTSTPQLLAETTARATRNLTYAEWQEFFADQSYPLLNHARPVHASVAAAATDLIVADKEAQGLQLFERIAALESRGSPAKPITARERAAGALLRRGRELATSDEIHAALDALRRAQAMQRDVAIPADTWNLIAWRGSLAGKAAEVLFAAEQAVEMDPQNLNFRDTRGLARALTGNIPGAIEDFKRFVAEAAAENYPPAMIERRHLWLAALALDRNPFTADMLRALREE